MNTKKILIYILTLYMFLYNFSTTIYAETETTTQPTTEMVTEITTATENTASETPLNMPQLELAAEAAILIDADSGIILYEKNAHERLYPASITKILTTLLACEYGKFDETVTHSHNAVFNIGPGSSHIGMDEGEEVNFKDALYGILLESANEVCMAIAEHIDGDVDTFVDRMNTRAKELGALDTHFANPHGFHDDNHYTTAYDMSLFAKAAVANKDFLEIFSTVDYDIPATNKNVERNLHNKDRMLRTTSPYYYEYAVGGKTGYTAEAGNTLISYAIKDDVKLISVVMKDPGAQYTYSDTVTLMEYGFSIYENKEVFPSNSYVSDTPITQKYKTRVIDLGTVGIANTETLTTLVPNFITPELVTFKTNINADIPLPVSIGDKVGTLDIYYNDYMIGTTDIVATTAIEPIPDKTLARQETLEKIKVTTIKVLKIIGIVILALIGILIILRIYFTIVRHIKRKRRRYSRYGSTRHTKKFNPSRKKKFKLKLK